jgi:hypothetical protein
MPPARLERAAYLLDTTDHRAAGTDHHAAGTDHRADHHTDDHTDDHGKTP